MSSGRLGSADLTAAADTTIYTTPIEYDAAVPGNGVLERTGIVLDASRRIVARASGSGVSAVVFGVEEAV